MGFLERLFGRRRSERTSGYDTAHGQPFPVTSGDQGQRGDERDDEGHGDEKGDAGQIDPSSQQIQVGEPGPTQDIDVGAGDSGGAGADSAAGGDFGGGGDSGGGGGDGGGGGGGE